MRSFVQAMLAKRYHLAEPHDRMWQLRWVTQHEVEKPTNDQGQYGK
jgi:hypothetical protein